MSKCDLNKVAFLFNIFTALELRLSKITYLNFLVLGLSFI